MNEPHSSTESPARKRTRNAILRAAVSVLSQNPAASLGEVADAAQVARSTLHRYYPERSDLLAAMRVFADEQITAARTRARLDDGTAADALIRLAQEYFDQWDILMWTYMEGLKDSCEPSEVEEDLDGELTIVIARGYDDGTIDRSLANAWIQSLLWALLYTAWEYIRQEGASKHDALDLTIRTLRKSITP